MSLRSYDCAFDWKEAVKGQHLLERNWTRGKYLTQKLRGHSGWVTCVDVHTNKLVSSSYDGTVRVWNTQTGNCLQTLPGDANTHDGLSPVWCCQFKGSHIMAGSSDSKIRQWDMNTGQVVRVFEAHAGGVKCLQVRDHHRRCSSIIDVTVLALLTYRPHKCDGTSLAVRPRYQPDAERQRRQDLQDL